MRVEVVGLTILIAALTVATPSLLSAGQVVVSVEGMVCSACPEAVKAALQRTNGVKEVKVSLERKEAIVDYDEKKIIPERLVEVINKLGFRATLKADADRERKK